MTLSTTVGASCEDIDATCTRPQKGRAVDAVALASRRSKPSLSDNNSGLSDSDSESSSDNDRCLSEGEHGCSSISKHSQGSDLDEQRLLAYNRSFRRVLES